ncbi:hypothetical protein [Nocardioides sp.]|uniref:hypothetical protein n=1 Tax=Nocardioides sp. TaxID=35761 RepID=UPI002ED21553
MTTSQIRTLTRRAAVVLTAALLPLIAAGPAGAEVPEGWSDPEPVSFLSMLVLLGAIPLAITLVLALGVYGPALARGENVAPGDDTPDQWFGGPRHRDELEAAGGDEKAVTTGGGSGRW